MAGELGFEPRQTESESVVLPLHHSPRIAQRNQRIMRSIGQCSRPDSMNPAHLAPFYSLAAALGNPSTVPWQARGDGLGARRPRQIRGRRRWRMSLSFEELDFRPTPMGLLTLRR